MLTGITAADALLTLSVFYGVAWLMTNTYIFSPVVGAVLTRVWTGVRTRDVAFVSTENITIKDPSVYPEIDVLVPGYEEHEVIHQAIQSIRETAYPDGKINLTVLLEPDDQRTIERVRSLQEEYTLDLVIVPAAYPGSPNKPRALNYGYEQTTAEIVGIIDAENVVSSDLFEKVAKAITVEGNDYVQGMVDMANEDDGWKNLVFRAEYGCWYRLIVPAFKRMGFPIPLSGTTCFFTRDLLADIATRRDDRKGSPHSDSDRSWLAENGLTGVTPWDPKNVTEDFEMGLYLWLTDYEFGLLDAVTKEESPQTVTNWMKQRTRWQKGKLFTFLDFLKNPAGSARQRFHVLWQSFLPHVGPLNIIGLTLLVGIGTALQFSPGITAVEWLLQLSLTFLVAGLLSFSVGYWLASTKPSGGKALRSVLVGVTVPVYWLLQWAADVRAFKQTAVGDLDWEKTVHKDSGRFRALQGGAEGPSTSLRASLGSTLRRHVLLVPILGAGLLLRLPQLGRSLWLDEAYSIVVRGSQPLYGVIAMVEPHPPLYYMLLHGWMGLFGQSELVTRSLSVLIGLCSIAAMYALSSYVYDRRAGLVAALVMATSTLQIQYSQTVRMYILIVLLTALSCYLYLRLLDSKSLENQFGYGIVTLALLYTHIYGSFILLAQCLHLGIFLVQHRRRAIVPVARVFKVAVAAGLLFLPWVLLMLVPNFILADSGGPTAWVTLPDLHTLRDISYAYANVPVNYPIIDYTGQQQLASRVILGGFALGLGYLVVRSIRKRVALWRETAEDGLLLTDGQGKQSPDGGLAGLEPPGGVSLATCVIVSTTLVPYLLSYLLFPLLVVRYAVAGFVGFTLILSRIVSALSSKKVQIGVALVVVLLAAPGIGTYYGSDTAEDWQTVGDKLSGANLTEDDLVVYSPNSKLPLSYYLPASERSRASNVTYANGSKVPRALSKGNFTTVWVVAYDNNPTEGQLVSHQAYEFENVTQAGENLALMRYARTDPPANETSKPRQRGTTSLSDSLRARPGLTRGW